MRRLRGVAAAPGAVVAPPWRYEAVSVTSEGGVTGGADLDIASERAAEELAELAERLRRAGRDEEAGILDAQALIARDPELLDAARAAVADGAAADVAIVASGEGAARMLEALDDPLLAARAVDVRDVAARIARILRGEAPPRLAQRSVAVAGDLPPSVTVELDPALLAGIALEGGSRTAHAAILARALGIPAVVGVDGLLAAVDGAARVGVNGDAGEIVIDPDASAAVELTAVARGAAARIVAEAAYRDVPLATRDGHRIVLAANVGRPEEALDALGAGAEAIGLFRTEFLFMGRPMPPDEATQAAAYASVLRAFPGGSVAIRLLDAGGDKAIPYLRGAEEANPFLGVRAIRLAERDPTLLVTQLRAILRAATETGHEPWIMAPMVADLGDVAAVRDLLRQALVSLGGEPPAYRFGIMIEVPSAALLADALSAEVDFLSIGTNDLTQYMLAADRTNPALAARQDPFHPAVLRAIASTVAGAARHQTPIAVCGEMAGDPAGAVCLVGLGVDELSMEPASFGRVKRALASVTLGEATEVARGAGDARDAAAARATVDALLAERGGAGG